MSKWKIGDLVTLSAAGRKSQQNEDVMTGFGMVIKITKSWNRYPIHCSWIGGDVAHQTFKDYELKKFK